MNQNQIPVQNIYYLLSYAWDKLKESELVAVKSCEYFSIIELFSKVLANGMNYIMRRGFDRGYVTYHDQIPSIKGRIDFSTTLKISLLRSPSLFCEYDELNYDILHNQIIRTTIHRLLQYEGLSSEIKDNLIQINNKLKNISLIPLTKKDFSLVQLHSNNYFYDFLLKVCELIFDNLLICEEDGSRKFKDFLRDQKVMAKLFEAFVRNFYKKEQIRFDVSSEYIGWHANPLTDWLPYMKTDISLIAKDSKRKIIIDTKYYMNTLQVYFNKESAHSGHLYQLYAYLANDDYKETQGIACEGILLYPTVDKELDLHTNIMGHRVSIRTINLNQDWKIIHMDLLDIIA